MRRTSCCPVRIWVEKEGTYTNDQGRLQGAAQAIRARRARRRDDSRDFLRRRPRRSGCRCAYTIRCGGARGDRGALVVESRVCRAAVADIRASDDGAPLAAGIESVGAMEMGLHVPGCAAGEIRLDADARFAARRHSAAPRAEAPQGRRRIRSRHAPTSRAATVRRVFVATAGLLLLGTLRSRAAARREAELTPLDEAAGVEAGKTRAPRARGPTARRDARPVATSRAIPHSSPPSSRIDAARRRHRRRNRLPAGDRSEAGRLPQPLAVFRASSRSACR